MSDTYTLKLNNFRSVHDTSVEIAPLTVVYGPNGAGKSSLIYGLLTLKGFLTNPNQNVPSLFNYPTMSLGGFEEVVWNHDIEKRISMELSVSTAWGRGDYILAIGQSGGESTINTYAIGIEDGFIIPMAIPFPYQVNQENALDIELKDGEGENTNITVLWNGIGLSLNRGPSVGAQLVTDLLRVANSPMELARSTAFVPLRRGFATPTYSVTNITPALATDLEVASLLHNDRFLEYAVSNYLEAIAMRQVRIRTQVGTSTFTIDSIPRNGGVPVSMVNDGFGINQLVYLLTVSLYAKSKIVTIEEPEIHLHPSMVRNLAKAIAEIARNEGKRFIISTHSETFVLSLLSQITAGKVDVNDVALILATKEGINSDFNSQQVLPNGQVEGGLDSFVASGFEDIATFLGLDREEHPTTNDSRIE